MYCGMPKGTCPAEATSNNETEKIKPVAFSVIELHLSEGIIYSVSSRYRGVAMVSAETPSEKIVCAPNLLMSRHMGDKIAMTYT